MCGQKYGGVSGEILHREVHEGRRRLEQQQVVGQVAYMITTVLLLIFIIQKMVLPVIGRTNNKDGGSTRAMGIRTGATKTSANDDAGSNATSASATTSSASDTSSNASTAIVPMGNDTTNRELSIVAPK